MGVIEWAGMQWPRSMDARQIADDWDTAVSMAAEYRDRQWIARNLGDVPMRIIDGDPMPAVALLREMGELADIALADAEARYANHLGRNR